MNTNSKTNQIQETSDLFSQQKSQMVTYSVVDFRAQLLVLLEKEQDFMKKIHEVLYFLKSAAFYGIKEHLFFSLRTSKDYSIMTMEKHLESSSLVWMNWGMTYNGSCLTARISESHKTEKGYLLAEVLEENVDQKYFLSAKQVERIMERTKTNKEKGRGFSPTFLQP